MLVQNMGNHMLGPGGLFSDQEQILCWFERFCWLFRNKGANCDLETSWRNSMWVTLRNVLHMYVVEVQLSTNRLWQFARYCRQGGGVSKNKLWLQNILTEFRVTLRNVSLSLSCIIERQLETVSAELQGFAGCSRAKAKSKLWSQDNRIVCRPLKGALLGSGSGWNRLGRFVLQCFAWQGGKSV